MYYRQPFWVFLCALFGLLALYYFYQYRHRDTSARLNSDQVRILRQENELLQGKLAQLKLELRNMESGIVARDEKLKQKDADLISLAQQTDAVLKQTRQEEARQQIQNQTDAIAREMLAALGEQSGARLAEKSGAPVIRIPNQTLFVPASGYLSEPGKALLRPLAQIIKTRSASFSFKLVGYTDNAKPAPALAKAYGSNKQISATRARNAAEFLTRESGLPPGSIACEGQGALWPVAPNQTPEGRAQNQRLEMLILPLSAPVN